MNIETIYNQSPRKYGIGIELTTPGSAVRLASVARHVTDCAARPREAQLLRLAKLLNLFMKPVYLLYSKTCVKRPLSKIQKIGFQEQLSLTTCQKYCRMLNRSILQYFRPSLSYQLSLRSLFCLFLSGCFTQVLLYFLECK